MSVTMIGAENTEDRAAKTIGVVGDSISAGTPAWDPDPMVRAKITNPDSRSTWQYWASLQTGMRFAVTAVDGQRTDQIAERLDLLWDVSDAIVIQGGINDIVQGRDVADAADHIAAMVEKAKARGIPVAITDVLPWNRGSAEHAAAIVRLNHQLRRIAEGHVTPVLPFYDVLTDPEAPGRMGDEWTTDGSHPNVLGHRRLGELAFVSPEGW